MKRKQNDKLINKRLGSQDPEGPDREETGPGIGKAKNNKDLTLSLN